jgi:hypothetical protein
MNMDIAAQLRGRIGLQGCMFVGFDILTAVQLHNVIRSAYNWDRDRMHVDVQWLSHCMDASFP